jgi:hypothetical protein
VRFSAAASFLPKTSSVPFALMGLHAFPEFQPPFHSPSV